MPTESRVAASRPSATASPWLGFPYEPAASSACAKVWPRLRTLRSPLSFGSRRQIARLVGGAGADEALVVPLPDRLAGEETRLHDLRHALGALLLRQRLEERRVDHDARRPVERTDEVLAGREVDPRLAADAGVHLADEASTGRTPRRSRACRSRRRSPPGRSSCRRRARRGCRRARGGGPRAGAGSSRPTSPPRRAAARAPSASRLPSAVWATGPQIPATWRSATSATLSRPGDELAEPLERARLDVDPRGGEDRVLDALSRARRRPARTAPALVEERAEGLLVLRERPVGAGDARHACRRRRRAGGEGVLAQAARSLRVLHGAAAERDDAGPANRARRGRAGARACGTRALPGVAKMSGIGPCAAAISSSVSAKGRPSASARPRPRVVLPAPMMPISATWRSRAFSPSRCHRGRPVDPRQVRGVGGDEVADRVAAELLAAPPSRARTRRPPPRRRRAPRRRRRRSARRAPRRLAGREVDGLERLHQRRQRLHGAADDELLPVRHPALEPARVVRLRWKPRSSR